MESAVLKERLEKISKMLDNGKDMVTDELILQFQSSVDDVISKLDSIMQEGRKLRLGIVGEVKAGKSSFLNALLFNGKDILPKAPTPMTAALTKVSYSEKPFAKIVFYNENDWNAVIANANIYDEELNKMYQKYKSDMENKSKEQNKFNLNLGKNVPTTNVPVKIKTLEEFEKDNRDRIPLQCRSCKELIDMARENNLNVSSLLGREKIVEGSADDEYGYVSSLNEYVGSDGKYTPLVKYTEISFANKMVEGIEVIDTPGLNDPISSRSRVTKQFLIECDAVFLLGYCGQFLGAEDMGFILTSLPNEGIKKAMLIGSKLDSAILQYPSRSKPSFKNAYLGTIRNCEAQARDNLNNCSINTYNEKIISQIKNSLPPTCISSVAYSASLQMRNGETLGEMEEWMVNTFKRRFPDFKADAQTLFDLSGISDVRDTFENTKKQKEEIIKEKISGLIESQQAKFLHQIDDIYMQAKNNLNDIENGDCEQLARKLNDMKEKLDSVRIIVRNRFESAAVSSRRKIEEMAVELMKEMQNHQSFEVATSSETKHHRNTTGHLWWKKTEHWDEVITTNSANVGDAESNMRNYYASCLEMVNSNFIHLLQIDKLKEQIKGDVMGAFEASDRNFDENKILVPLDTTLNRITIPEVEIDLSKYESMLDGKLAGIVSNGVVQNENIPVLKRAQDQVIAAMSQDIIFNVKEQGKMIDNKLQVQGSAFIDSIVGQLNENQQKMEKLIQNKRESVSKMRKFIEELRNSKRTLLEV